MMSCRSQRHHAAGKIKVAPKVQFVERTSPQSIFLLKVGHQVAFPAVRTSLHKSAIPTSGMRPEFR
jgi:hypothetical protein